MSLILAKGFKYLMKDYKLILRFFCLFIVFYSLLGFSFKTKKSDFFAELPLSIQKIEKIIIDI